MEFYYVHLYNRLTHHIESIHENINYLLEKAIDLESLSEDEAKSFMDGYRMTHHICLETYERFYKTYKLLPDHARRILEANTDFQAILHNHSVIQNLVDRRTNCYMQLKYFDKINIDKIIRG